MSAVGCMWTSREVFEWRSAFLSDSRAFTLMTWYCLLFGICSPHGHRGGARRGAVGPTLLSIFSTTGDEQGAEADGAREGSHG